MQSITQRMVLSPSDLVNFLACRRLTELSVEVLIGKLERPSQLDSEVEVLRRRGLEHEGSYLQELKATGRSVECISEDGDLEARVAQTVDAIRRGVDIIYQAAFFDTSGDGPAWVGFADFLHKVDEPSALGAFSYEPEDAKLARRVKPGAVVQLCAYAEQLERLQGRAPELIHVRLGSGERETLRRKDHSAFYRAAKARFLEALEEGIAAYPDPVEHCHVCMWRDVCDERRLADDHLSIVPGLRSDQIRKLQEGTGIETVAALAELAGPFAGIGDTTVEKLIRQARLLVKAREEPAERPPFELLGPVEIGRGLGALPAPSPGDLFFDIESDPFIGDGGLEYLFGIGWAEVDGEFAYRSFWAHDRHEEKLSFEALIDFVTDRLATFPDLHVYHYASYEPTALGRLMGRHGTREDEVDSFLRAGVLVDLYQVVRQALCVGAPSYSLKKIEGLYLNARTEAITDGGSSIVEYERWSEEGDSQILADLEEYNRVDCDSTRLLRDFLEGLRPIYAAAFGEEPPRPPLGSFDPPDAVLAAATENAALKASLAARAGSEDQDQATATMLLGELLDWYRREAKPAWWKYFDRVLRCDETDLYDDTESIAGLEYVGVDRTELRSHVHRYRFDPAQEHKLSVGQQVRDPDLERMRILEGTKLPGPGTLVHLDATEGVLELKRSISSRAPHPRCLIPEGPLHTNDQREALRRVAKAVITGGIDGEGTYRSARDLLQRLPPRVGREASGASLHLPGEEAVETMVRIAGTLDGGVLAVQGPPGSGKTYSAAAVICELVRAGRSVGITANSHAVITKLLEEVMRQAAELGPTFVASQKADDDQALDHPSVQVRSIWQDVLADLDAGIRLIAGTAWLFAREAFDQRLDYLVIDEAGQLSLANVLAVGSAARNLILVGDPRQLAQPSQGTHPDGAGVSGLEHLLDGRDTMPAELGLFMEHTRRLHPAICSFVSELAYEDRLQSLAECENQTILGTGALSGSGLRWVPISHANNRVSAPEEAQVVSALVDALIGRIWVDHKGDERALSLDDLLVVAPYNAQVALLRELLPDGARIGTVDKFQGQEAPVVIVSLTTSSVQLAPRGMQFLYSRNRLNVAVSRAQALTVMVGSPELLAAPCRSLEEIRLANGLCRYVELAIEVDPSEVRGQSRKGLQAGRR